MKIVQVCPRYYPYFGGVETHVKEISERLVKKGFEVEVLTTDPYGKLLKEDVINDVKIKRFRSYAPGEAYYFSKKLKTYLLKNSNKYSIVHAHSYHALPALYAAQAKGSNKLVFTPHFHGRGHTFFRNLLHIPYKYFARKIFDKADKIICVSYSEKKLILEKFKVDEKKIEIISNGVNLNKFKNLEKRKEKNRKNILYVGRLEKYKCVDYIIKALPLLDKNIYLEIVGDGPYKKVLMKLVNKLNVKDRVKFYGNLSGKELLEKYAEADLFVLLSKHEAFGISVAEALASGLPSIVANTSALKEWVDNENCFGIDYPINVQELAQLINKVIGKSITKIQLPSWDDVVERLVELYMSLIN